ncbi:uncharacterized protein LOC107017210 [Solanum pennellii]|uniref:Uncharacterized protein LOC107017210 n=1 Tax=Solanum pennellii TaxID=28526 RepID=A0ABM1GLR0_SOLPN|nr:uncharacterized protein LOC107017210 [Solanum pennellii]
MDPICYRQLPPQTRKSSMDANQLTVMDPIEHSKKPGQLRMPPMDAHQLTAMNATEHTKKPEQCRNITNAERTAPTPSNLTAPTKLPELPPTLVEWAYADLTKLRINYLRRQHAHIRAFIRSTNLQEPSGAN